jgi:hypothetical protein
MPESGSGFHIHGVIMKRTVLYTLATLMAGCLLAACAGTGITLVNTWKNPDYPSRKCVRLLVTGVSENYGRRMLFEDVFAHELQSEGISALQSYFVISGPALSREIMKNAVKTAGADCVITTRLESIQKETKVIPGYATLGSTSPPDAYPDYYVESLTVVMTPPTMITNIKTTVETVLFETGTAKKIWGTGAVSYDVTNLAPVTKEYARSIFKVLKKEGLL